MKDFQGWVGGWGKEKGESQASLAWAWPELGNKLSQGWLAGSENLKKAAT